MKRILTALCAAAVACLGLAVLSPGTTSADPSMGTEPDLGSGIIHREFTNGPPTLRNIWISGSDAHYVSVDIAFLSGGPETKLNVYRSGLYEPDVNDMPTAEKDTLVLVPGQRRTFTFEYCRGVTLEFEKGAGYVSYRIVQLSNPFLATDR
jgi:hypothetical protein